MIIRVLALKNVNVIFKDFLTFYGSKTFASENCKLLELYCSSILNIYIYIYILFQNVIVGIGSLVGKKWWLKRNNKERLKNNILIKK